MFSLLRQAILSILFFFVTLLIKIGDVVLWFPIQIVRLSKGFTLPSLRFSIKKSRLHRRGLIYVAKPRYARAIETKVVKRRVKIMYLVPLALKFKFFFLGVLFSFLALFLPLVVFIFLQDLPNPKLLSSRQIPQTTKMYDRNGTLLYEIYASQNRTLVPLSSVPKYLADATIAIEDKDFYNHKGADIAGIARAARETLVNKNLQGGSTITQQLLKSAILTSEISVSRKVKEVTLALWTERIYSKEQILEMYFNQVPYGGTAYGIGAASEVYFGKSVEELTLAESAFLAGLPAAPSIFSPFSKTPTAWVPRQQEVLHRMVELGHITAEQAEEAVKTELVFKPQRIPILAPHFVMYVRDFLIDRYGSDMVERGGLSVTTSLDLQIQDEVEKIVKEEVQNASNLLVSNGASLVTKPGTGEILAMVGSVGYFNEGDGNVNATRALRQPGSAIKVVTYAAALQRGFTAATLLDDSPVSYTVNGYQTYAPVNYDGRFRGRIPLRLALGNSLNVPAVKTLNTIGVDAFVETGKKMGVTSWGDSKNYGLSITLGAADLTMAEMATVFGTLANGGVRKNLNPILKITNYKGEIIENGSGGGERVLPQNVAFILFDILSDNSARVMEFGPNSPLKIDEKKVAVKTGTSDEKRDNWTIGYTRDIVVATWVGNFNNSPMHPSLASGITGAAPMWRRIMLHALSKKELGNHEPLQAPSDVIGIPCQGRTEYFVKGTERGAQCRFTPVSTPAAALTR